MSSFYATNKEVKRLSAKLDLLNAKLDLLNTKLDNPVIYITRLEDSPSATEVEIGQFVILTDEELSTWVSNGVNWVKVL